MKRQDPRSHGHGLLARLKVRDKLLFSLVAVAVAFSIVIGLLLVSGERTQSLFERIENEEVPALDLRRDLEAILSSYQRSLQDAAAAEDLTLLELADERRAAFLAALETGQTNQAMNPEVLTRLSRDFETYSDLSRATTRGLIERGPDAGLIDALGQMTTSYSGIKKELEDATVRQREELGRAFAAARRQQRLVVVTGVALVLAVLLPLSGLTFLLIRHLNRSLGQAVSVAEALARGDVSPQIVVESDDEIGNLLRSMSRMTGYLREMAIAADAMASGDFTAEVVPRCESDVFGKAFEKMSSSLGEMIGRMAQAADRVLSSATRISSAAGEITQGAEGQSVATEQTASTMQEIAAQIDSVSKSMLTLAGSVEETSSSMHQIAAAIDGDARNTDDFLSSVETTATTIEQMAVSIQAIAAKVGRADKVSQAGAAMVEKEAAELSRLMREIGSSSEDIGKIVQINEDIASQTRLLAINAAIEAAHAGGAAEGVGVVAGEVKQLAEQASESAREIADYVETVQRTTRNALTVTERVLGRILDSVMRSSDLVREVTVATEEHREGTRVVLATSTQMRDTTREMALSAREQASSASQILHAVVDMSDMTQQVARASEEQRQGGSLVVDSVAEIARIASEHLGAAEGLSGATSELACEARTLQHMSEQFVLSSKHNGDGGRNE